MLAALPHYRSCTNLHHSVYLDQNGYRRKNSHHRRKIPRSEELYAHTYIRLAYSRFDMIELPKCYRLGRVACQAEVESALESALCVGQVEVHLFLCVSSMSVDSLWCHSGKEGTRIFGFDEALPRVFVLQLSPFYARKLNTPLVLFLDLGARFHNEIFRFLYCGA
jgi:hypothetical protein